MGPWSWWGREVHLFAVSIWAVVIRTRLPHLWGPSQYLVRGEVACPGVEQTRFDPEPTLAGALGSSRGRRACPLPTPPRGSAQALGPTDGLGQCLAVPVPKASARMGRGTELETPADLPLTCQDSCQPHLRRAAPQTPRWQDGVSEAGRRAVLQPHRQQPHTGPGQPRFGGVTPGFKQVTAPGGCLEWRAPAGTPPSSPAVSPASCATRCTTTS